MKDIKLLDNLNQQIKTQDTLNRLQGIFHKVGITRVANVTHLDQFYGIFISNCIRPNSQNLSISQGKGSTLELSYISAIMESIEAYHVENPPPCSFNGSFNNLYNSDLINPRRLYLTEFETNIEEIEFSWTLVENILDKKKKFIPLSFTKINTCMPNLDYLYFNVSSNGLAAGNSKDEALYHAICEIIERYSLAKWQLQPYPFKNTVIINPNTVNDLNSEFIDNLYRHKLSIKIWEITSELGIPAYHVAIIDNHNLRDLNIFTGTGAHLSKSNALFRAISEAIQGRLTYISGIRDDVFSGYYKKMRLNDSMFSSLDIAASCKNYMDAATIPISDVITNLNILIDILVKNNYQQILVCNHTKPDISIPVVQVFIPGMLLNNSRM